VNIQVSGEVYSCLCHRWMPQCIGNIFDKDFFRVWHSNTMRSIRSSANQGNYSLCSANECPNVHVLPDKERDLVASPLPRRIMLTIDQSCNLACASCRLQPIIDKHHDKARRILDHVFGYYKKYAVPVEIFCDGFGDVFASRSYLDFFAENELPHNVKLSITTNGTQIHKYHDLIHKLRDNIHSFVISFDAGTKATYKITRGADFDQLCDNVRWLTAQDITVHSQFVLQKQNQQEIVDYYRLGIELQFKTIAMQLLDRWDHHTDEWWYNNCVQVDAELMTDLKYLEDQGVAMCGGIKHLIAKHHNLVAC
jgi:MoaA/NifB/PqqE/SkfB family radical SAM enzyme